MKKIKKRYFYKSIPSGVAILFLLVLLALSFLRYEAPYTLVHTYQNAQAASDASTTSMRWFAISNEDSAKAFAKQYLEETGKKLKKECPLDIDEYIYVVSRGCTVRKLSYSTSIFGGSKGGGQPTPGHNLSAYVVATEDPSTDYRPVKVPTGLRRVSGGYPSDVSPSVLPFGRTLYTYTRSIENKYTQEDKRKRRPPNRNISVRGTAFLFLQCPCPAPKSGRAFSISPLRYGLFERRYSRRTLGKRPSRRVRP